MATEIISLNVSAEAAQAFKKASQQEQERLQHVVEGMLLSHGDGNRAEAITPERTVSFDDIKHLWGTVQGPGDLSTNPNYMEGFGESSLR